MENINKLLNRNDTETKIKNILNLLRINFSREKILNKIHKLHDIKKEIIALIRKEIKPRSYVRIYWLCHA